MLIPLLYLLISLILMAITVNGTQKIEDANKSIFLTTNGVHLGIAIPLESLDSLLIDGLAPEPAENFLSFGWGDENFYLNTPTWADLTFNNATRALFLKSPTLMHVTRIENHSKYWVQIEVSESQMQQLNEYLLAAFARDKQGEKIILANQGYTSKDDFYKAVGNYTLFNTCNTWVNTGFKRSGLKACLWTPFDFGLMWKYE